MSRSDDCASGIHEFCSHCDCECHGYIFTKSEIAALYRLLSHQYISYVDEEIITVVKRISKIVSEERC